MLGQAGLHLHTFPEVAFSLDKWTMQGYPCVLDKTPNRQLDIHVSTLNPLKQPFCVSRICMARYISTRDCLHEETLHWIVIIGINVLG